ncbi:hypothetical protein D3C75_474270 [compost metagenome]
MAKVKFEAGKDDVVLAKMTGSQDVFVVAQMNSKNHAHALANTLDMLEAYESINQAAIEATFTLYMPAIIRHRPSVLIAKQIEESIKIWEAPIL